MDIVTVVYRDDIIPLTLQAHSLKKFWFGSTTWNIVVEDQSYIDVHKAISPIMEGWNLNIIQAPSIQCRYGWQRQQVYKLWSVAELSKSKDVLVLDAKNYLKETCMRQWFWDNDKQKVNISNEGSELFQATCDFFGLDSSNLLEITNITPQVMNKDITKDVIQLIKNKGIDIYKTDIFPIAEFHAYWIIAQKQLNITDCKLCDVFNPADKQKRTKHLQPWSSFRREFYFDTNSVKWLKEELKRIDLDYEFIT